MLKDLQNSELEKLRRDEILLQAPYDGSMYLSGNGDNELNQNSISERVENPNFPQILSKEEKKKILEEMKIYYKIYLTIIGKDIKYNIIFDPKKVDNNYNEINIKKYEEFSWEWDTNLEMVCMSAQEHANLQIMGLWSHKHQINREKLEHEQETKIIERKLRSILSIITNSIQTYINMNKHEIIKSLTFKDCNKYLFLEQDNLTHLEICLCIEDFDKIYYKSHNPKQPYLTCDLKQSHDIIYLEYKYEIKFKKKQFSIIYNIKDGEFKMATEQQDATNSTLKDVRDELDSIIKNVNEQSKKSLTDIQELRNTRKNILSQNQYIVEETLELLISHFNPFLEFYKEVYANVFNSYKKSLQKVKHNNKSVPDRSTVFFEAPSTKPSSTSM